MLSCRGAHGARGVRRDRGCGCTEAPQVKVPWLDPAWQTRQVRHWLTAGASSLVLGIGMDDANA